MSSYPDTTLEWRDGQPWSRRFRDVYFSRASGIEEARHVFLAGNRLPERIAQLPPAGRFVVAETGFGTGLNFLCAWALWEQLAHRSAVLHYLSAERYPLTAAELERALALWPELASFATQLMSQYRQVTPGWHRLQLSRGRVFLTLLIGDAREVLGGLPCCVDAWFLDGFSPDRNPELWEPRVFQAVAASSRVGATLATYTVAGAVRRGLNAAGFHVTKTPGFGSKREMLSGQLQGQPWTPLDDSGARNAIVIGAGLAGCAVASSLAARGWGVVLLERRAAPAQEASGNPQAMLYLRLSATRTALAHVALAGYQYTLGWLRHLLPPDGRAWSDCGVLQLALGPEHSKRQARVLEDEWPPTLLRAVDRQDASAIAGFGLSAGGLLFEGAGWVHPPAVCHALLAHPGIDLRPNCDAIRLRQSAAGQWQVWTAATLIAEARAVVLTGGIDTAGFAQAAHLPVHAVRGQVTLLPQTDASARLRAVLCGDGYVAPARAGVHTVGATFTRTGSGVTLDENAQNLAKLAGLAPELYQALGGDRIDLDRADARAGVRCVSADRLPIIGPVGPDAGLYVSTAHGSRGLLTAPIAGELLAALLAGEPLPIQPELAQAVAPRRFASHRELSGSAGSKDLF